MYVFINIYIHLAVIINPLYPFYRKVSAITALTVMINYVYSKKQLNLVSFKACSNLYLLT